MHILGVSCYYHDAAAALLRDGVLVAAAEEERFTRKKHDNGFPHQAIRFCLNQAGISGREVDYVVFYEKPLLKFERILLTTLAAFPYSCSLFRESMIALFNQKLWIKSQLMAELDLPASKVLFVEHHISHAASTFFCSPFEKAAVLTLDGVGEWTTAAQGRAQADWDGTGQNSIVLTGEIRFPHSLGLLYSAFTAFLGFQVNEGEYKVMGMAPYGEPRYVDDVLKLVEIASDGSFCLNMDYFCYHRSTTRTYSDKFLDCFGPSRPPESEFFTPQTHPGRDGPEARRNQRYADIAASIQRVTEEIVVKMARSLQRQTGLSKLCLAGGVALNCVANGRVLNESGFDDIYIQPAAGDAGGALGAALYAYHVLLGKPRRFVLDHAYWGQAHSRDDIRSFLDGRSVDYQYIGDEERLCCKVAEAIASGKVIGWFQGRFEWGPRALGNRSILADPRRAEMKQIVNEKIKFREPFRPFAPVIPAELTAQYFDLKQAERLYPARFMLLVAPIRPEKQTEIPAVNHRGTGRVQTVTRETNPLYYRVLEQFGQRTAVPVLLNTSFNLRGEPMVASPPDAFNTFTRSGIDMLVMDHFVISK